MSPPSSSGHSNQDKLAGLGDPRQSNQHIFSFFGKIKSDVQHCRFKEEEGESDMAKLLNNVQNGERQIWMEPVHDVLSMLKTVLDKQMQKSVKQMGWPGIKRS